MCAHHPGEAKEQRPVAPFVVWPLAAAPAALVWQQALYQLAWQQALAATSRRRPPELFAIWN